MQVGDLVKIRPAIARPELYGIGIIVKKEGERCFVRWSKMPVYRLNGCAPYALELISAANR